MTSTSQPVIWPRWPGERSHYVSHYSSSNRMNSRRRREKLVQCESVDKEVAPEDFVQGLKS